MQAVQLVGKEITDPLGPEFERVVRRTGLGAPLEDVLGEPVDRLPKKELEVVVQAILAQRKTAGNLAICRKRWKIRSEAESGIPEELKTLTAQGKCHPGLSRYCRLDWDCI